MSDFKNAAGVVPWNEGDELPEDVIRRLRDGGDDMGDYYYRKYREAEAAATRRLKLLRRWDEYRKGRERPCPFCFEINHTGFCELAEELKDESRS